MLKCCLESFISWSPTAELEKHHTITRPLAGMGSKKTTVTPMTHPKHSNFLLPCKGDFPSVMFLSGGGLTTFLGSIRQATKIDQGSVPKMLKISHTEFHITMFRDNVT